MLPQSIAGKSSEILPFISPKRVSIVVTGSLKIAVAAVIKIIATKDREFYL
jgi:hypothetical protein